MRQSAPTCCVDSVIFETSHRHCYWCNPNGRTELGWPNPCPWCFVGAVLNPKLIDSTGSPCTRVYIRSVWVTLRGKGHVFVCCLSGRFPRRDFVVMLFALLTKHTLPTIHRWTSQPVLRGENTNHHICIQSCCYETYTGLHCVLGFYLFVFFPVAGGVSRGPRSARAASTTCTAFLCSSR